MEREVAWATGTPCEPGVREGARACADDADDVRVDASAAAARVGGARPDASAAAAQVDDDGARADAPAATAQVNDARADGDARVGAQADAPQMSMRVDAPSVTTQVDADAGEEDFRSPGQEAVRKAHVPNDDAPDGGRVTLLRAEGLRKRYFRATREAAGDFDAVDGVSLVLGSGELVVLMGRSGSGKSTLLGMLGGLVAPTAGTVRLDGRDLYALDDRALARLRNERIGVVPQGQTPLHALTVLENVTLPLAMRAGLAGERASGEKRALALLERLGIAGLAGSYPSELSGGELRRMAIARALVGGPSVLLADEPTGDLDDESTVVVLEVLREAADAGAAVLVVTHDSEAAAYADHVMRMDAGRLVNPA